VSNKRIG